MTPHMLTGTVVLDLTHYLAGPTVTRLMAELGADIIKVEAAPHGDPARFMPYRKDDRSAYFVQQNRGKKSVCVDLNTDDGVALVRRLARRADVVVENYGPGVLDRRGLGYEALSAEHDGLIMCSISAFGHGNAYSHLTGFDYIAQGFSGMMDVTGEPDGPPQPNGVSVADGVSGVTAFGAIGYALLHRERTGRGQHIDISMVDSLYHLQAYTVQQYTTSGGTYIPARVGTRHPDAATIGVFDGPTGPIVLFVVERQWRALCEAMGRPDLVDDPQFAKHRDRLANRDALATIFEAWMAAQGSNEAVLERLAEHRVPAGPVLTIAETTTHPYFEERGMIRDVPDPVLGSLRIPGSPLRYSEFADPLDLVAPLLGEHNDEVLQGIGVEGAELSRLYAAGVVRRGAT